MRMLAWVISLIQYYQIGKIRSRGYEAEIILNDKKLQNACEMWDAKMHLGR